MFTTFNIIGASVWATGVVLLGYGLAHIPGVSEFAARYIDVILVGIVVVSVVPVAVRAIASRRRLAQSRS